MSGDIRAWLARWRVSVRRRVWLAGVVVVLAVGAWAGPARAVTYTQQTVVGGLPSVNTVAVDPGGDVFVCCSGHSPFELPAGGSQQTLPITGLSDNTSVAVDDAGDLFVADTFNVRVVELPAGGTPQTLPITGVSLPYGVAVDSAGDVFVADFYGKVVELPVGGSQRTLPITGLSLPTNVAADPAGDVFVVDLHDDRVIELTATGVQRTLGAQGTLAGPSGVAVDSAGDVFVADTGHGRVVELPVGGTQQVLPFSGVRSPLGVAADLAGDVFVADSFSGRVVELSPSLTTGSFVLSPGSGPPGSAIGLASASPCKLLSGGAFAASRAKLFLYSQDGRLLQTATVPLGDLGSWAGSLRVPTDATAGTSYVVRARCTDAEGVMAQAYRPATFTVQGPISGRKGQTRSSGPAALRLLDERSHCSTKPRKSGPKKAASTKACTYRFTYGIKTNRQFKVVASAKVHGHRRVVAHGQVRHRKLTLVFRHLGRGRYRLTLLKPGAHGKLTAIGRTSIAVS
jgi:streptogramin lyase